MAEESFNKFWEFEDGQEVCLKHSKEAKEYLRIADKDGDECDWDGKLGGGRATWIATVTSEGIVQLQNKKCEGFLKHDKDGGWKATGKKDGPATKFTLERYGKGGAILRTEKDYDGVNPAPGSKNDDPRPVYIYTLGEKQEYSTPFTKESGDKKVVIIQRSIDCNQLRSKKEEVELNKAGGTGENAQWKIIHEDGTYRFKSIKTGGFLRIQKDGNIDCDGKKEGKATEFEIEQIFDDIPHHVYIKSCAHGTYIGVGNGGKVKAVDDADQKSRLAIFEANE